MFILKHNFLFQLFQFSELIMLYGQLLKSGQ